MTAPRFRHTATLLNSGRVLITGGLAVDSGFLQTYQSTEIFDPSTNTFTASGNMIAGRRSHTASLLISGKVLISGGTSNTGTATVTSELYDPATNAFSAGPQMVFDRSGHAAVSLTDGTVLILGGAANTISGGVASAGGLYLSAAELYNPATNGFVAVGSMQSARSLSAAVRLNDGRVLVSGGISNIGVVNQVEVYNPTTETFSITGATGWFGYAQNATLLADGKVLVTGGFGLTSYL
jgi:N-acetylneuraminic acid mutarotase